MDVVVFESEAVSFAAAGSAPVGSLALPRGVWRLQWGGAVDAGTLTDLRVGATVCLSGRRKGVFQGPRYAVRPTAQPAVGSEGTLEIASDGHASVAFDLANAGVQPMTARMRAVAIREF